MTAKELEAFSAAWAAAWGERLNASSAYREAAAEWEGAVILEMQAEEGHPARAVFLDLWRGTCRAARVAGAADRDTAGYILSGSRTAWRQVMAQEGSPIMAILSGRLRLVRGDLGALLPYAAAARELLGAIATFSTRFD